MKKIQHSVKTFRKQDVPAGPRTESSNQAASRTLGSYRYASQKGSQ